MKKRIFCLMLMFLVTFFGCATEDTLSTTSEQDSLVTSQTKTETTETSQSIDLPLPIIQMNVSYPASDAFSEAETRLLFMSEGMMKCYNKFTEEIMPFCFDPLCYHGGNCISNRFFMAGNGMQSIEYADYDNRFYALRGEQLYSFAFDGGDFRLVHSFGEEGKIENGNFYQYNGFRSLRIQDQFVYLIAIDNESGDNILVRYNIETKKLERIFSNEKTNILGYQISKEYLYLSLAGNDAGLYRMKLDGSGMIKLSDELYRDFDDGIFDGQMLYFVQKDNEKGNDTYGQLLSFTPETDEVKTLMQIEGEAAYKLLAVTEDHIYYTRQDKVLLGFYVNEMGSTERFNYCSKIYRLDKKSGDIKIVLDDIRCDTMSIYFVGENVIINGHICVQNETKASRELGTWIAKLDEDGMFTELTVLE